jgi:hypothetical protein
MRTMRYTFRVGSVVEMLELQTYHDRRRPTHVFAKIHRSLHDIGAFMPSTHDGRSSRKLQEESGVFNAVHTNLSSIALIGSYMRPPIQRAVWRILQEKQTYYFRMLLVQELQADGNILLSSSLDGFYKKLLMNLRFVPCIVNYGDIHKEWS